MLGSPREIRTALSLVPAVPMASINRMPAVTKLIRREDDRLSVIPFLLRLVALLPLHLLNIRGRCLVCGGRSRIFLVFLGVTHELDDRVEAFRSAADYEPRDQKVKPVRHGRTSLRNSRRYGLQHAEVAVDGKHNAAGDSDNPNDQFL